MRRALCCALGILILLALPAPALADDGAAPPPGSAAAVVAAALGEVGYVEGENEYSKYGAWYGRPNGYWCDMFVSWCANEAGVSRKVFPRSASCTTHLNAFREQGRFEPSAARGGTYVPKQGDLIFYYEPLNAPRGNRSSHIGLVLYVEDGYVFTVEGNALPGRLDCLDRFRIFRGPEPEEHYREYVVVNRYPLDNPRTLGYASPGYADGPALELDGFVDLGRYADWGEQFRRLAEAGIMPGTSAHTFSPCHGMGRGEFLAALMTACGLTVGGERAEPFSDVPADAPWYDGVMTARALGITSGVGDNRFAPERYISGGEARWMISAALALRGVDYQGFEFERGDYSDEYGEFATRGSLAAVLYDISALLIDR